MNEKLKKHSLDWTQENFRKVGDFVPKCGDRGSH